MVYGAFEDWKKARVRPEVKAALGMLAKLTLQPLEFGRDDLAFLMGLSVSSAGIEQAVVVGGYIFNYQNRMADTLGADIPKDKITRAGKMLNLTGRAMLKDRNGNDEIESSNTRIPSQIQKMVTDVVDGSGNSDVDLRRAIFQRGISQLGLDEASTKIPENLIHFVDTIFRYAPDIKDDDIQNLLAAGWSEEEIFEITVVASVAAGYGRLRIAWDALSQVQ